MRPRNNIVYLSVPESLRGQIESMSHGHDHGDDNHSHDHGDDYHDHDHTGEGEEGSGFSIDPAIPIPVELPPGETKLDLEQLSWEMILSGMIRVVSDFVGISDYAENSGAPAAEPEISAEDADYYRHFVLAVKPDILGEFTEAAILKARNGDYDMALEIMAALMGLFPVAPVVLLNRALILENRAAALEQAGREAEAEAGYESAHEAYKDILALNPPFPDGLFNAGFFYMKGRNYQKARKSFAAYLSLEEDSRGQDNPEFRVRLPQEKRDRAKEIVREIESRSLDDELFQEAYDYIRLGEEQKGLERIRTFLEQHPRVWNAWFILGWGLRRLSRWEDASAAFTQAIELGGGNSDTRNELSICLMELGDFRGARKELEAALREEPENVKIISNLGVLALRSGEDDEAAGFFRTVLEMEPGDPLAREYLGKTEGRV